MMLPVSTGYAIILVALKVFHAVSPLKRRAASPSEIGKEGCP